MGPKSNITGVLLSRDPGNKCEIDPQGRIPCEDGSGGRMLQVHAKQSPGFPGDRC